MKKIYLLIVLVLCACLAKAQPWIPPHGAAPLKFSDVLERYRQMYPGNDDRDNVSVAGNEPREDDAYFFNRWVWYWSQHLDKDGYIVPPSHTLRAWQAYHTAHDNGAAAKTTSSPSNWIFMGPRTCTGGYSGLGRINTVAFDPIDSNTFYIGSAAGSTWKTTDGGLTWASLYDNLPTLGVSDIKINPQNRNTIYVATGDGDAGDTYSSGVIISHNGGASWSTTGLSWLPTDNNDARSLIINPLDTATIILGTNHGLYITHNAGLSWTMTATGDYKQVLYCPTDTTIVYGTVYAGSSAQIVRSVNGGNTWTTITSFSAAQRINIAVSPAAAYLVMAVASNSSSGLQGVYSSYDFGASYNPVFTDDTSCANNILGYDLGLPTTSCGGQGWYDLCIAISPVDPARVIIGGVNTYYSVDGGTSWDIVNTWWGGISGVETVHADKHCLAYNQLSGALYECCDGGIYRNYEPVTGAWTDLTNGIYITEFYRNAVDNGVNFCIGGAQDNGTKKITPTGASDLTGGDGMQPLINYGNPANVFYTSSQNGSINMTRNGGATYHSITDTLHESGGWISPYSLHPSDTETLVLAFKRVYVTHNNGISWTPLSPVFDSNDNIGVLRIATSNPNYLYTVTSNYTIWKSVIHYTADFGITWDTISIPFSNFISDLQVDPKNEKRFWVTVSGYGASKVYQYDLPTNTWTDQSGSLPDLPIDCMVIDSSTRTQYIGTDAAVFFKDSTMSDWALYNNHLPSVHVYDLHINYTKGLLWAATYGRGMWRTTKAENAPALSIPQVAVSPITVTPNPNRGKFSILADASRAGNTVTVRLLDSEGRSIFERSCVFDAGGRIDLNNTGLAPGFYICVVSDKSELSRNKLIVY